MIKTFQLLQEYPNSGLKGTIVQTGVEETIAYYRKYSDFWFEVGDFLLFTTEDGVDVYNEEQICYACYDGDYKLLKETAYYLYKFAVKGRKFSTEEACLEYIWNNKPLTSLKLSDFKNELTEKGLEIIMNKLK